MAPLMNKQMTDQEWQATLQRHRRAQIERLRAINRNSVDVSDEYRADISRAASGIFWQRSDWKPEPPTRWYSEITREYGSQRRAI
jgi:hypothetical protein